MLVIFDCDGVLVDSEIMSLNALIALLKRHGVTIDLEECSHQFLGKNTEDTRIIFRDTYKVNVSPNFNAEFDAYLIKTLSTGLRPIAGITNLLSQLENYCVASSGSPAKIANSLRVTGLLPLFPKAHTFSANGVERGKPFPDLFLLAAKKMGFAPADCVVVEDSPSGIKAAIAAGMVPVGFVGGGHANTPAHREKLREAGAEHVFDTMAAVKTYLDSLPSVSKAS